MTELAGEGCNVLCKSNLRNTYAYIAILVASLNIGDVKEGDLKI